MATKRLRTSGGGIINNNAATGTLIINGGSWNINGRGSGTHTVTYNPAVFSDTELLNMKRILGVEPEGPIRYDFSGATAYLLFRNALDNATVGHFIVYKADGVSKPSNENQVACRSSYIDGAPA